MSSYQQKTADDQINLRGDIEAQEVRLRDGLFNGVTAKVESNQTRLILTQQNWSTSYPSPPPIAYEYHRDPKPQFVCVGRYDYDPSAPDATTGGSINESDFREGFFRGLHRAASLLLIEERKCRHSDWKAARVLGDAVDRLREVADELGFQRSDLYSLYPGDEAEYNKGANNK